MYPKSHLQIPLELSLRQDAEAGIEQAIPSLPCLSPGELKKEKSAARGFYTLGNPLLRHELSLIDPLLPICFAIVNQNLAVLRSYCTASFEAIASVKGIRDGCVVDRSVIGTSAISLGIDNRTPCLTVKEENYCSLFSDLCVGFVPCYYNTPDSEGNDRLHGGIAVFCVSTEMSSLALSIADSLIYTICDDLARSNGYLHWIDTNSVKIVLNYASTPMLVYYAPYLWTMLGIKEQPDILYNNAFNAIDPPAENPEFWDLYYNRRNVRNQIIPVSLFGKRSYYEIATQYERQPMLGHETFSILIHPSREIDKNKPGTENLKTFDDIKGHSTVMLAIKETAAQYAGTGMNILICGERGTGKDVFAQAIHSASSRKDRPFLAINCASLPKDLIVSELFGYERGAFSGSRPDGYPGKIALADKGTLFLDEIGTLAPDLQAVLLRVLEEKQFLRLGGTKPISVDVRFIFATNADLAKMVSEGTFRADLFDRIRALTLRLPSLNERKEDIPELVYAFTRNATDIQNGYKVNSKGAVEYLMARSWPGNVRELRNTVEAVTLTTPNLLLRRDNYEKYFRMQVQIEQPRTADLPTGSEVPATGISYGETESSSIAGKADPAPQQTGPSDRLPYRDPSKNITITAARGQITKEDVMRALVSAHDNKTYAAKLLGISRQTLYEKIRRFEL